MDEIVDTGTLSTVSSIISGFGVAMLFFRIQRELQMHERNERIWIPWADWLLMAATLISLLIVLLPLVMFRNSAFAMKVAVAACGATILLVAGYVLAILAHHRLLGGGSRSGQRDNPEPVERILIYVTVVLSLLCFAIALLVPTSSSAQLVLNSLALSYIGGILGGPMGEILKEVHDILNIVGPPLISLAGVWLGWRLSFHSQRWQRRLDNLSDQFAALREVMKVVSNIPPDLGLPELISKIETDQGFRDSLAHRLVRLFGLRTELVPHLDGEIIRFIDQTFRPLFIIGTGRYDLSTDKAVQFGNAAFELRQLVSNVEQRLVAKYDRLSAEATA